MSARRQSGTAFANPDDELDAFSVDANADNGPVDGPLDDVIDFTDVNERAAGAFPVIPAGTYPATVESCVYTISKSAARNPMWAWVFNVFIEETGKIRKQRYYTILTREKIAQVKKDIMRVAPDLDLAGVNLKEAPAEMVGRECRLKIGIQTPSSGDYAGIAQNNVREILVAEDNAAGLNEFLS